MLRLFPVGELEVVCLHVGGSEAVWTGKHYILVFVIAPQTSAEVFVLKLMRSVHRKR